MFTCVGMNLYITGVYSKVFTVQSLVANLAMPLCRCEQYVVHIHMYDRVKYSKAKVLTRLSSMTNSECPSCPLRDWQGPSQDPSNLSFVQVVS